MATRADAGGARARTLPATETRLLHSNPKCGPQALKNLGAGSEGDVLFIHCLCVGLSCFAILDSASASIVFIKLFRHYDYMHMLKKIMGVATR